MKRYLLLLSLFVLPFLSSAQRIDPKNIELGFTVSPNLGWMRVTNREGQPITSEGSRAGVSYGILADLGFARNYYFSTAFIITSINSKIAGLNPVSDSSIPAVTTYKTQYIEVPLTLKLKTNPSDLGRFYGQFGLGTGVKISGQESVNGEEDNKASEVNAVRLSLIAGVGAEWDIRSSFRLQTGLTLNHGLTNAISSQYDIRSDYLALSLGVFF
jgi:hypothetical protein